MAIDPTKGGYFRSQREEARKQREARDLMRERALREAGGDLTEEEELSYRERIEGLSFGAYPVTPLPNKPEYYGRGPSKSTRVGGHKFVPTSRAVNPSDPANPSQKYQVNGGTVYVRFNRPSKRQAEMGDTVVYKYTNVPVAIYEAFRNNASKGRYINNPLNTYGPQRVNNDSDEFTRYCTDL